MIKRAMVQIPVEQVRKLKDLDRVRGDIAGYPLSKKVHLLLQEKLAEIFADRSFPPHSDGKQRENWFEYIREIIPIHVIAPLAIGVTLYSKQMIGTGFTRILFIYDGNRFWWCNYKQDIYNVGNYLLDRLPDKSFADKYYGNYDRIFKETKALCENYIGKDLGKLSKEKLLEQYNYFYSKICKFHALSFDIDAVDIMLERRMKSDEKTYSILTAPTTLSFVNQEQLEVYEVAENLSKKKPHKLLPYSNDIISKMIRSKYPGIAKDITGLVRKYWWTGLSWSSRAEKTFETFVADIIEVLKTHKNIHEEISRLKNFVIRSKAEKKKLKLDEDVRNYLEIFEHYTIFHDYRKEIQMKSTKVMNSFLFELSRRYSGKFDDLQWCWPSEIQGYIMSGTINLVEAQKRKEAFFALVTSEGIEQYSGEMALKRKNEELSASIENIQNFKGIGASLGKASGKAKVCYSSEEAANKIIPGDILVASMTTPDYVSAMKKVAAIVTDEGGVTAHAAIISREMRIPCIVGTKIATKILNDNDFIEVDANHGRVTILERGQ